jgi:glutamyl-tRNA synthetase
MGITHVIRGDDHLNNAARQLQIIKAMGWPEPTYGHVPLIHGPDGAKLSKRHGALAVEAYRDMGYLAEAMRNYLLRLGWSHGDDEIIPTSQAIEWFNLESIGKSPARMDMKKLDNINGHYMRQSDDDALAGLTAELLARLDPPQSLDDKAMARLKAAMPGLKERAKTLVELGQAAEFLYTDGPRDLDAAAEKLLPAEARALLGELTPILAEGDWDTAVLEEKVRAFAAAKELKLGKVAQPLRAALTGKASSPPIFDVLAVLGREESLVRLRTYAE